MNSSVLSKNDSFLAGRLIDGKALAASVVDGLRTEVAERVAQGLRPPQLATVIVAGDAASEVYVRNKREACRRIGMSSLPIELPAAVTESVLLACIDELNANSEVDGILVQLPLPNHIDSAAVIERIRPDKDVDGFHPESAGRLMQRIPRLRPCTPYGVIELLKSVGETFVGRRAVVVGSSNIVGRPMAMELLLERAVVTVTHSATPDLAADVSQADILVVAIGKPDFVKGHWIKPGATVIDVGINRRSDGKLCGDVEFESARQRASWITPVPGGVGPMTVAMLMRNTLLATRLREQEFRP